MKKVFFSFAIAAAAALMASCGNVANGGEAVDSVDIAEEDIDMDYETFDDMDNETFDVPVATKSEDRGFYTVGMSDQWVAKQYVSEMTLKKGEVEMNFKEGAQSDVEKWIENIAPAAEAELNGIFIGGRHWKVYKNVQGFKTLYIAQVGEGVVRIGSNIEDPNSVDVIEILAGIKEK